MKGSKPIYTIGHRNPDTDSICSAIAYAHLKQALGENVVAARAGKVNAETKYALEYFGAQAPMLVADLYPRVKDVILECNTVVKESDNLRKLGEVMRAGDTKSVPVVNAEGKLSGIVTVSDLAKRYFNELSMQDLAEAGVTLQAIADVVDGEIVVEGDGSERVTGNVQIAAGNCQSVHRVVRPGDVVLVGDRTDGTMLMCVKSDIACLIVTGSGRIPAEVVEAAQERRILVVSSPYNTYTCARLVNQCIPVGKIMQSEVTVFKPTDMLSDIKDVMENSQFRNYPVVENERLVGVVSRDQLIVPEREQVILVDHNERSQAVEGIEEAKILEIIDHHRLGGIQTSEPIYTRQEPVGCTATIIANLHWQRGVEIPRQIAGLLLSAILSDTVLFKSPTCTAEDREAAERLAPVAGVDLQEYGMELLKAGSAIGDMTAMEIAKNDLKEFQIADYRIVISQISVMDPQEALARKDELLACMENICRNESYDMSLLMVTDILRESTELLFTGSPKTIIGEAFKKDASGCVISLPGVMSRKKQIVPPLVEAAKRYEA